VDRQTTGEHATRLNEDRGQADSLDWPERALSPTEGRRNSAETGEANGTLSDQRESIVVQDRPDSPLNALLDGVSCRVSEENSSKLEHSLTQEQKQARNVPSNAG